MKPVKYGQIGTGHGHASKIRNYQESADFEVVGIVEPDPRLKEAAIKSGRYKNVTWLTEEQLFNTPGLEVIGVETNVPELLDTAEKCINEGFHIHLDKPAGASLPQFKRILDKAAARHQVVQMGYMYRYNPAFLLLKSFLQKGWLGEIFELHAVMSKVVSPGSRSELAQFQGGMMLELGCHLIDLVVGVLGEPDEVTPYMQHVSTEHDDALNDNTLAVFQYPNALASVKSAGVEVGGFARRHLVVCGSKGTYHMQPLDAPDVKVAFDESHAGYKKGYQDIKFGNYSRYVKDVSELAKWVRGQADPEYTYDHDYTVQKTLLKACDMPLD